MLFIIRQHVQPAFIMAAMQSQQAWIMAQQASSPLVQVMRQPSSIISHLHMPITRLQQQAIIPFHITQQEHIPPASIVHRFWIIEADILSSVLQVIVIPPAHFSMVMVQRGTIIMFMPVGIVPVVPIVAVLMPAVPIPAIPVRSTIIVFIAVPPLGSQVFMTLGRRPRAGCHTNRIIQGPTANARTYPRNMISESSRRYRSTNRSK
jgi:hypothetical protein